MHRDLKLSNFGLCGRMPIEAGNFRPMLVDFGTAVSFESAHLDRHVGTDHYRAPEILKSTRY
jgi:serine/threonine protein kinase